MIVLREWRSANVPPSGLSSTPGSVLKVSRRPIRLAEPVACMVQNIIATMNI